ncbi:MAG TPA: ferredoxin [Candidatus Omnitrophota bacterium]|nr:ferredoxin [Candidatus Omnitrophota bacterium]
MKVKVDQDVCIGCGLCAQVAPDVFEMQGDKASVVAGVSADKAEDAKNAAEQCPVTAITVA